MNNIGKDYCLKIKSLIKKHKKDLDLLFQPLGCFIPKPHWDDPLFQERLLRIGVEYKNFELDMWNTKELEEIVLISFEEDILKRYNYL